MRRFYARMPTTHQRPSYRNVVVHGIAAAPVVTEEEVVPAGGVAEIPDKILWFSLRDASTVWSDSARTTPASLGGTIGGITDKSGREHHAYQPDSARHPAYLLNDGLPALQGDGLGFSGGDELWVEAGLGDEPVGPRHIFAVAYWDLVTPYGYMIGFASDGAGLHYIYSTDKSWGVQYSVFRRGGPDMTGPGRRLMEITNDSDGSYGDVTLHSDGAGSYGSRCDEFGFPITSGAYQTRFPHYFNEQPIHELLIFSRILSEEERRSVLAELETAWNLSLTITDWVPATCP